MSYDKIEIFFKRISLAIEKRMVNSPPTLYDKFDSGKKTVNFINYILR